MDVEAGAAAVGHESVQASPVSPRRAPEFPGCRTMPLKCDEVATYEGRFEFWDAATETAWVMREPTSATHEHPSHHLATLCLAIASVRGSAIACFGAMGLELRDEHGERPRPPRNGHCAGGSATPAGVAGASQPPRPYQRKTPRSISPC